MHALRYDRVHVHPHVGRAGEEDAPRGGVTLVHDLQQAAAVHAGAEVQVRHDGEAVPVALQQAERLLRASGLQHDGPGHAAADVPRDEGAHRGVVVHDEDAALGHAFAERGGKLEVVAHRAGRVERGFDYFDHTADVGIRAWGPSLEDAFAAAAEGLVAYMVDAGEARDVGEAVIEAEAESEERLLYRFLEEVLYLFETRRWVITSAAVELGGGRLRATLRGEAYDAGRHGHVHEVKAITFHDLHVQRAPPEVRVIVDI